MKDKETGFLDTAIKAARAASEIILENLGRLSKRDINLKQASDFVTPVDRDSEEAIIRTIREKFPDHSFLAEESSKDTMAEECLWIIDPLDGTTNYIHSYPMFAVSIALAHRGEIITGVILDPLRDELFTAERDKGAFLNGKAIRVSEISQLQDSLLATGFPFRKKDLIDVYLKLFGNLFRRVSGIRRAGSAALDLAYLACGRCDGFFEIGLSPWDIAAGSLIIQESGGIITDFGGGADYLSTCNIVAASPALHGEILKEVQRVFRGIIDR